MKHIKKSFYRQKSSDEFDKEIKNIPGMTEVLLGEVQLKNLKNKIVFTQTTDNITIAGLVQKIGNDYCIFPVPDPTLVHFHSAQMNLIHAKESKKQLIKSLSPEELRKKLPIHELYNYYGHATSVIINLFTALESFLNQQIPSNYIYTRKSNRCTEIFNCEQIFESIDFKTKLTEIIPDITKKDFMGKSTPSNGYIWSLKEFRDSVIHTKPKSEAPLYHDLMKKSLDYKYDKAIESVAKLMNFYQPDYIKECDCELDY